MKKIKAISAALMLCLITTIGISTQVSARMSEPSCSAGGPGATSCEVKVDTVVGGVTYSVTCGSGYYACCSGVGASCKEN